MIVMSLKLDNICGFNDFEINLSYPKKIVNSNIENEFLSGRSNFRYKKLIVLMGANASGKTTLGKALMAIFNFISRKNVEAIASLINNKKKEASFLIEFIPKGTTYKLYRIEVVLHPISSSTDIYREEDVDLVVKSVSVNQTDSYEICKAKLDHIEGKKESYIQAFESVENFGWFFTYPNAIDTIRSIKDVSKDGFRKILEVVLSSLDSSIQEVKESSDIEDSYIIKLDGHDLIIKDDKVLNGEILSSGTKSGIDVAILLTSIIADKNGFYYCDEKFSYIHSDLEKAILSKMIEKLGMNEQLFFTTHNTDILNMSLPKHSFVFLKKEQFNGRCEIRCVYPDHYLKRNTDSLRKAVENDLFSITPNLNAIDGL